MSTAAWGLVWGLALALALLVAVAGLWWREHRRVRTLRRELRVTREKVERVAGAQGTFFDLVSHELRSPLAAVLGYQELLVDGAYGELEPAAADALDRVGRSARHLLNLIDGVMELSRLRAGILEPEVERISLGMIVATAAENLRSHALDRDIRAEITVADAFGSARTDPARLIRALDLLVTSAVKHPHRDGLRFTADPIDDSGGPGLMVRISGLDMPAESRADDPALRYGLRLAVVRRVAELLGGGVEFDEDPRSDDRIRAITFRIRSLPVPDPGPQDPL